MSALPFVEYPVLQVRPNTLLVYSRREWNPAILEASKLKKVKESRSAQKTAQPLPDLFRKAISVNYLPALMQGSNKQQSEAESMRKNFRGRKAYSGKMSDHGRKRMKRAINLLIAAAKWKTATDYKSGKDFRFLINFITLTLPAAQGKHSDKEVKKHILDPWIKKAKRKWNLKSYVWRAEKQGNGNIHFHICSDVFIPHKELRDTWNESAEALGYVSAYEKTHKHRNPNSTDVHAVKNINNLAGYIVKYMSKDHVTKKELNLITGVRFAHGTAARAKAQKALDKCLNLSEEPLDGKVWDCSTNLKIKNNCELFLEEEQEAIWIEERKRNPKQVTDKDRFSLITYRRSDFLRMLRGPIKARWNDYLDGIRNYERPERSKKEPEVILQKTGTDCPF